MSQKIKRIGEERFLVKSDECDSEYYEVDLEMPWCECKGFYYTKKPCKHIKLAREEKEKYKANQGGAPPHPHP